VSVIIGNRSKAYTSIPRIYHRPSRFLPRQRLVITILSLGLGSNTPPPPPSHPHTCPNLVVLVIWRLVLSMSLGHPLAGLTFCRNPSKIDDVDPNTLILADALAAKSPGMAAEYTNEGQLMRWWSTMIWELV
jgi:hypothetical protein